MNKVKRGRPVIPRTDGMSAQEAAIQKYRETRQNITISKDVYTQIAEFAPDKKTRDFINNILKEWLANKVS